MFEFAETTKDMTAKEILNYYRNLYYSEPQVTERGIVANAINDVLADVVLKSEVAREIIDEFMSAMRVKHEENRPKYGGALALLLPDIEQIASDLKKKYVEGL